MEMKRMVIVDRDRGLVELLIDDDRTASIIGSHHAAIGQYLETGDDERLRDFRGQRIRSGFDRFELETDPEAIEQLAMAGELDYDDIYVTE